MPNIWNTIIHFKYVTPILMVLMVIGTIFLYHRVTRRMWRITMNRAKDTKKALTVFFVWRYVFMGGIFVFLLITSGGTLTALGLSAVFFTTLISWGLTIPIMNASAWLMIILRKPYRIGDRVIIDNLMGDVKDISLTYTSLEQVGGTVMGESRSGRTLMIPNHRLFDTTIINYMFGDPYVLGELPVRLTFDSNIELAEQIMMRHAREVIADTIEKTGTEPFVRFEFFASGIIARLRFRVVAVDRGRITSQIVGRIFKEFTRTDGIRFAYEQLDCLLWQSDEYALNPLHPLD